MHWTEHTDWASESRELSGVYLYCFYFFIVRSFSGCLTWNWLVVVVSWLLSSSTFVFSWTFTVSCVCVRYFTNYSSYLSSNNKNWQWKWLDKNAYNTYIDTKKEKQNYKKSIDSSNNILCKRLERTAKLWSNNSSLLNMFQKCIFYVWSSLSIYHFLWLLVTNHCL